MSAQQIIDQARETARLLLAEAARDEDRFFPRGKEYRSLLMVARHDMCGLIREVEQLLEKHNGR